MKILFIVRDMEYESIGLMTLSAVLKKAGHETHALCSKYEVDLFQKIRELNPEVIGYSTTTGEHKYYLDLNRQLKKNLKFVSIFGGPHPTFFPEIVEEEGVDAICLGEGEEAIFEFVDNLSKKREPDGIKNIYFKRGKEIIKSELRPFIEDLDSIPFPDREIFKKYYDKLPTPYRVFITGRGCPYSCSYCFNHAYKKMFTGKYIRHRNVNLIMEEIKEVKREGNLKICGFLDDTFTIDYKWLESFCDVYAIHIKIPFFCHLRADLVDGDISRLLFEAGCIAGVIGVETGSHYMRKNILKKNISDEEIISAADHLKRNGIRVITQNMIGIPEDTPENVLKMVRINSRIKSNHMNLYFYQPYPRTDLCNLSIERGLYSGDVERIGASYSAYDSEIVLDLKNKSDLLILASLFHLAVRVPFFLRILSFMIKIPVLKDLLKLLKPIDKYYRNKDFLKVGGFIG
ncbi:B12-binding domain-containing radical SAM protein [bacterium]|nr:B12-binding domain-containing radical SAM protein [bacterium]